MSKAAKDGNNFRREWDKEAFEARAKARLEAELSLEDDRERKKTETGVIVQRAPLQRGPLEHGARALELVVERALRRAHALARTRESGERRRGVISSKLPGPFTEAGGRLL